MAKHNRAADAVVKGAHFEHLGHFRDRKILERGHNTDHEADPEPGQSKLEKCLKKCEGKGRVRKRVCETNCLIND